MLRCDLLAAQSISNDQSLEACRAPPVACHSRGKHCGIRHPCPHTEFLHLHCCCCCLVTAPESTQNFSPKPPVLSLQVPNQVQDNSCSACHSTLTTVANWSALHSAHNIFVSHSKFIFSQLSLKIHFSAIKQKQVSHRQHHRWSVIPGS